MQTSNTMTRTPSPVDNATYNLLQALTSKLEAIEAYNKYAADSDGTGIFERLAREDAEHAKDLLSELRKKLTG